MERKYWLFFIIFLLSPQLLAKKFTVVALFENKAVLAINKKNLLLKKGITKKGFTLISTNVFKQTLVLDVDGQKKTYRMGQYVGGGYAKPKVNQVRILAHRSGSFLSTGSINGQGVNFLLDTGATSVSMNSRIAKRLGIVYRVEANKGIVSTAAGQRDAYRVVLDKVSIGSITLNDVNGLVLEGDNPEVTLLGMSFLGQLEVKHQDNLMVITKKF